MNKEGKISVNCLIFSLSILFLLFSRESSFTIQSIIIPIVLLLMYILFHEKQFVINKKFKWLFYFFIVCTFSTIINFIRHGFNTYSLIQIFYYFVIILWFFVATQGKFNKKEFMFFVNIYLFFCLLSAIYVIFCNLVYKNNTFAIINFLNIKMEKNYFGAIMSISPLFATYKLIYGKHKILNLVAIVTLFWAIIYSNSRGALLSAGASCVILVFIFLIKSANKKIIITTLLLMCCGFICLKPIVKKLPYYNRYFVNSYNDVSNNDRVYRWKNAIDGFIKQPILGYGPGVLYSIEEYQYTDLNIKVNQSTISHNTFLDVLVDGGIVGILLFLMFLWNVFQPFIFKYIIYLPIIINLMINAGILGAFKTVYFWNIIIFLFLLGKSLKANHGSNLDYNIFNDKEGVECAK